MSKEKALAAYKGKKLNCAQSVLSGFKESHGVDDRRILEAHAHGGGKAPGGRCGALHGALELLGDSRKAASEEAFLAVAGALQCREIRKHKKLSCEDCVGLAAEIVESMTRKDGDKKGQDRMSSPALTDENLSMMRNQWHRLCFACGEGGLELRHEVGPGNRLRTSFFCDEKYKGYGGRLHGGVISTLMDSAMTNCLFAAGIAAVTGEFNVRFLRPVSLGGHVTVSAWVEGCKSPLYLMRAEMSQDGLLKCRASAKFMKAINIEVN